MRCKFCFATFQDVKKTILPKGCLPKQDAVKVVEELANYGFEKITFAGGEPTLCPWLSNLISTAHEAGMTTMIVTNGSRIDDEFLKSNRDKLDWIALSVDSTNYKTNNSIGRQMSSAAIQELDYWGLVDKIKSYGYGLKINTVVNSKNVREELSEFIAYANPIRWKVLQVLPVKGQNDTSFDDFEVSTADFKEFVTRHADLNAITKVVPESNEFMRGSYVMVDPAGRFFDNTDGGHKYSQPILKIGARSAFEEVRMDLSKFIQRGGIYRWERPRHNKITLSGEVASGKTTVGKILAKKLGAEFVSIGERTRERATEMGLSIVRFQKKCVQNPSIDRDLDKTFSEQCNAEKNPLVIDYRLGFHFIQDSFNVFLRISKDAAIQRLKNAGRTNETHHTVDQRNASFKKLFLSSYMVDYTDPNWFDLIVNVESFREPEEIAEFILKKFRIR